MSTASSTQQITEGTDLGQDYEYSSEVTALARKLVAEYVDDALTSEPGYVYDFDTLIPLYYSSDSNTKPDLPIGSGENFGFRQKDTSDKEVHSLTKAEAKGHLDRWSEVEDSDPLIPNTLLPVMRMDPALGGQILEALKDAFGDFDSLDEVWDTIKLIRREYRRTREPNLVPTPLDFPVLDGDNPLVEAYYSVCEAQRFIRDTKPSVIDPLDMVEPEAVKKFNELMAAPVLDTIKSKDLRDRVETRMMRTKTRVYSYRNLCSILGRLYWIFKMVLNQGMGMSEDEVGNSVSQLTKCIEELSEFEKTFEEFPPTPDPDPVVQHGDNLNPLPGFMIKMSYVQSDMSSISEIILQKDRMETLPERYRQELLNDAKKAKEVMSRWHKRAEVSDTEVLDAK